MSFDITPRQYARYQSDDGRIQDMRYYDDDKPVFTSLSPDLRMSTTWHRVALTTRRYTSESAARAELDALLSTLHGDHDDPQS